MGSRGRLEVDHMIASWKVVVPAIADINDVRVIEILT